MLSAVSLSGRLQHAAQNYCLQNRYPKEALSTKTIKDWIVPVTTSLAIAILTAPLDTVVCLLSTFTIIPLLFLDNKLEHLINTAVTVCVVVIAPFFFLINLFGAGQFLPLDYSKSYLNSRSSLKMLLIASERFPQLDSLIKLRVSDLTKDAARKKLSCNEQMLLLLLESKPFEDLKLIIKIARNDKCYLPIQTILSTSILKTEEKINLVKKIIPLVNPNATDAYGKTAFGSACFYGYSEIVDLLLPCAKGCSAEFFADAFHSASLGGHEEIIKKVHSACPDLIPEINKTHSSLFGRFPISLIKLITGFGVQFSAEDLGIAMAQGNYEIAEWILDHNPSLEKLNYVCYLGRRAHSGVVQDLAKLGYVKACKLMHSNYAAQYNFSHEYLRDILTSASNASTESNQELRYDHNEIIEALLPDLKEAINHRFSFLTGRLQSEISNRSPDLAREPEQRTDPEGYMIQEMLFLLPYVTHDKANLEIAMINFTKGGDFEALKTLLTYNLDVNSPKIVGSSVVPVFPWTSHNIIYMAVKQKRDNKIAKMLIEHGAYYPKVFLRNDTRWEENPFKQHNITFQVMEDSQQLEILWNHHNVIRTALKLKLEALGVIQALGHIVADYAYGGIQWPKAIEAVSVEEQGADEAQATTWDDLGT